MTSIRIVSESAALDCWTSDWRRLLERSEGASPMLGPDWLCSWWRVFGDSDGRRLRIGLIFDEKRLIGLAPLLCRRHWYRSLIPFRRLELLGTGENDRDEICSDYIGVLAERGSEALVAETLVRGLLNGAFGGWDELVLTSMNGEAALPQLLQERLSSSALSTTLAVTNQSPYVPLPRSFDDYLKALPSQRRYLVRRSLRDFEQWAGSRACLHSVTRESELEQGFAILERLHAERWAANDKSGAFASQRFRAFHAAVMPRLFAAGSLDLSWISVDDEPIAALYNVVHDGKVYFYQSGRKPSLPRGIRPGIVMHAHAIRRAIEAGRREYDFLAGQSRYKLDLALANRPLVELRAVRASLVEAMRRVAELGVRGLKAAREELRELRDDRAPVGDPTGAAAAVHAR